jgi:hypothetical protein
MSDATAVRIRLEDQREWHWGKVDESYCTIKNPIF